MKNLFFLLSLLIVGYANGQNCNDLIVSEIVFGYQGSTLQGEVTQYNHSVEVFNPTDAPLDLSNYRIELLPETGTNTIIDLEGIVPSKDVFVISNVTANIGITSVSDVLDLLLSFEGKVAIQLSKTTGEVIDKIGRQGVETTSETIDITAFLNDPEAYLSTFDVNLGSIENLLIRRKGLVQKGNTDFQNEDLLEEWIIYPGFEISDLGNHLNACVVPILSWEGAFQVMPEEERWEYQSQQVIGSIICTEDLPAGVVLLIENFGHQFQSPVAEEAWWLEDYAYIDNVEFPIEVILPELDQGESYEVPLLSVLDDFDIEMDEGTGFTFGVTNDQGTGVVPDQFGDHFDVLIKDDESTSIQNKLRDESVSVTPTVVENLVTIKISENTSNTIKAIHLYGIEGKFSHSFQFERVKEAQLDLSSFQSFGYHFLYIETDVGAVTKKIIKTH